MEQNIYQNADTKLPESEKQSKLPGFAGKSQDVDTESNEMLEEEYEGCSMSKDTVVKVAIGLFLVLGCIFLVTLGISILLVGQQNKLAAHDNQLDKDNIQVDVHVPPNEEMKNFFRWLKKRWSLHAGHGHPVMPAGTMYTTTGSD